MWAEANPLSHRSIEYHPALAPSSLSRCQCLLSLCIFRVGDVCVDHKFHSVKANGWTDSPTEHKKVSPTTNKSIASLQTLINGWYCFWGPSAVAPLSAVHHYPQTLVDILVINWASAWIQPTKKNMREWNSARSYTFFFCHSIVSIIWYPTHFWRIIHA